MLTIRNLSKTFHPGTVNARKALEGINLTLNDGDFITVIGGNGAGKSTLLNAIAGSFPVDTGSIRLDDIELTSLSEPDRAKYLGRVFQDPMVGTAPSMQIVENLSISARRGRKRTLRWGVTREEKSRYYDLLKELGLGLENRMEDKVHLLSGGQRQALTLLMATLRKPHLLLLDEHTAALDPATAETVLEMTERIVNRHHLTTLMVTHNMQNALRYGNRLLMLDQGHIILDIGPEKKERLTVEDLIEKFRILSREGSAPDRMILE